MRPMICLSGEPDQLPFLPEIMALNAGIELGSYGLIGITSARAWRERFRKHKATASRFKGPVAIHGPFIGMEYAHADHLLRAAAEKRLDLTFRAAVGLKAVRVVLHAGLNPAIGLFHLEAEWLENNAAFWKKEIGRWAKAGIGIGIENETEKAPDLLVRLIDAVNHPDFGLCLDVGHQHVFSEQPAADWIEAMDGRLHHLHLHDNNGDLDSHLPMGKGTIDFDSIFNALEKHAPGASLSIEVKAPMKTKMNDLRALARRLKDVE